MSKLTEEQLRNWLESDEYMISSKGSWAEEQLFKIPLNDDFALIYYKRATQDESFGLNKDLKNVGLYYKQDGCIYNPDYYIKSMCEETTMFKSKSQKSDFAEQLTASVKARVEEIIDNKRSNISIKELSDGYLLNQMQYYSEHGAAREAKSAFIKGDEPSDIVYKCPYSINSMSDADYIQFIADKEPLVEREANAYIEQYQENILAQFYNNALLKKELQSIYNDPGNVLHRVKAIINAVEQSGAKTVNVTVNKDDKDFTFKYETRTLKFAPDSYYSSYYMKASDRREFENLFGRSTDFYPNEITQITYGRNVIYDASEFDMTETEDAAMAEQTM